MTAPAAEDTALLSFTELRRIAAANPLVRACVEIRKNEMRALRWDIVPDPCRVTVRGGAAGNALSAARKFWERPDGAYMNFDGWLRAALEQLLVTDALAIFGRRTLGGWLCSLELLDAATIEPALSPSGGCDGWRQRLSEVPRRAAAEILASPTPGRFFRHEDLAYCVMTSRPWTPFGLPPVERCAGSDDDGVLKAFGLPGSVLGSSLEGADEGTAASWPRQLRDYMAGVLTSLLPAGLRWKWEQP